MIDDHSRVAYVEAHDNQTKETATQVLKNAVAWFAERGVTVTSVLSDNGSCYKSRLWAQTCVDLGITAKKTRPQTNGEIERFHRTLAVLARVIATDLGRLGQWIRGTEGATGTEPASTEPSVDGS